MESVKQDGAEVGCRREDWWNKMADVVMDVTGINLARRFGSGGKGVVIGAWPP